MGRAAPCHADPLPLCSVCACAVVEWCRDIGVVGYWIAAIVIESLLWLANVGVGGYSLYRVYIVRGLLHVLR